MGSFLHFGVFSELFNIFEKNERELKSPKIPFETIIKAEKGGGVMPERQVCPRETLRGKWKLALLRRLSEGCVRWGNLVHSIPGAAPNVLTRQLRQLEEDGLVRRSITSVQPPQTVVYQLTPLGARYVPLVKALTEWCRRYAPEQEASLTDCQRVISGQWLIPILLFSRKTLRFGELHQQLGELSRGVLAKQLQELCAMDLLCQYRHNCFPPQVDYTLSERGRALMEILSRQLDI